MPYSLDTIPIEGLGVIVVDMQNDFVAEGAPFEAESGRRVMPNISRIIEAARAQGRPVIYTAATFRADGCDAGRMTDLYPVMEDGTTLRAGTRGWEIYRDIAPKSDDEIIRKRAYNAFYHTELEDILRGYGVSTVAIVGVTTENCCGDTARGAVARGFKVAFISDATGTFDYPDVGQGGLSADEVHSAMLTVLAFAVADVMDTDDFLSRLVETGDRSHINA